MYREDVEREAMLIAQAHRQMVERLGARLRRCVARLGFAG